MADYKLIIEEYNKIITLLKDDDREVSREMIQVINDDIEDIQIILGNAFQIQPKLNKHTIGFDIN